MGRLDESVEFATNPDPRCPCVLLLDTSGSMSGPPINALNEGLQAFQDDIQNDQLAQRRVELAIVTFGPVQLAQDFVTGGAVPRAEAARNCPPRHEVLRELNRTERYNRQLHPASGELVVLNVVLKGL